MINMNDDFIKRITMLRGNTGKKWLEHIPEIIQRYEQQWDIKINPPFHLTYNYVAPGETNAGVQVVIKIILNTYGEFYHEMEALKQFNGNKAAQLLNFNTKDSILLLEKVIPGTPLSQVMDDEVTTKIGVDIARKLWRKPEMSSNLIPLEKWFEGFERLRKKSPETYKLLPKDIINEGERLFAKLLETTKEKMLIHGDFHHDNILRSFRDEWLVIDPKGIIGDPVYDLAVFLYNPVWQLPRRNNLSDIIQRRINIFSKELDVDKVRIIEWGIAQSVLSSLWNIEDNENNRWQYTLHFAELLLKLRSNL